MDSAALATCFSLAMLVGGAPAAHAQTAPATAPAAPVATDPLNAPPSAALSDRIKREAASPMYWIKLHADQASKDDDRAAGKEPAKRAVAVRRPAAPVELPEHRDAATARFAPPFLRPADPVAEVPPSAEQPVNGAPLAALKATYSAPPPPPPAARLNIAPPLSNAAGFEPAPADNSSGKKTANAPMAPLAALNAALATPDNAPPPELVIISSHDTVFPGALMRTLRQGSVQIRVHVSPGGKVVQSDIVESSDPRLENAAVEAVKTMRFQPIPHATSAILNFGFDLDG